MTDYVIYDCPYFLMGMELTDGYVTGLDFEADICRNVTAVHPENRIAYEKAKAYLDAFFAGEKVSNETVPVKLIGTEFQKSVWEEIAKIPYGATLTYGEIALKIAEKTGVPRMSAQAVGGATGRNPIPVIIPCHRVMGAGGKLTGFTGGMDKKITLLKLEGHETENGVLVK